MAKQKLSPKAAADKKKRDLAFAKTFARKKKKAENQRKDVLPSKPERTSAEKTMTIKQRHLQV